MKIRTRLTLWYAGVLLASVVIMGAGMYYELVVERKTAKAAGRRKVPMETEVTEIVLFYCLPTMMITVAGGWLLMRRAMAPLDTLTRAAEQIQLHNLRQKLPRSESGDEVDRLTAVLNDMTDRLDRAFVQMHEFSLHASHELKTPLAVLHGELELCLQDPAATPSQRETFASLLDEIQRLMKIVSALAFLAKADAGQALLERQPVDLQDLVTDIVGDAQILAQAKAISVECVECRETVIVADRHRLRQLLLNLTENAIKYNLHGGRVLFSLTHEGEMARFQIANTGPGIEAEKLPKVFDRFYRGDAAHSSEVEGSGLGLTIARWIVEAHGGTIRITSIPDQWTTLTVHLPRSLSAASFSSSQPDKTPAALAG